MSLRGHCWPLASQHCPAECLLGQVQDDTPSGGRPDCPRAAGLKSQRPPGEMSHTDARGDPACPGHCQVADADIPKLLAIPMCKTQPPGLQNVTACGETVLKAAIKVKGSQVGRPEPNVTSVLIRRGAWHTDTHKEVTRRAHRQRQPSPRPAARPPKGPAAERTSDPQPPSLGGHRGLWCESPGCGAWLRRPRRLTEAARGGVS